MLKWVQTNVIPVLFCAITSLVAALAIMFTMWQGAMHKAETYRHTAEAQTRVIEAQSHITQNETRVTHVTDRVVQRIMEAPNANTPLPPDVADAWLAGIVSLRNDVSSAPDGSDADLHGPASEHSDGDNRNDSGTTSSDIKPAGSSISKVQLPAK